MSKNKKTYAIKNLSEEQLRTISDALEIYVRMNLLQFDNVIDNLFNWGSNKNISDAFFEKREEIRQHCYELRNLLVTKDEVMNKYHSNSDWSLGIGSDKISNKSQIAYEIEKDITCSIFGDRRGKLTISNETPTIVKEENPREEKLKQIIEKINTVKNSDEIK